MKSGAVTIRGSNRPPPQGDHAEPVTVIIKTQRLDLDVLSKDVEAHLLCKRDVADKRAVVGRGVKPVGPVALIQKPAVEQNAVVER